VDATGNSEICKKLNCEFLDDKEKIQPINLRFVMGGVDIKRFGNYLLEIDNDRMSSPVEVIDGQVHLSCAYTWDTDKHWALAPLFKAAIKENLLKAADTNYFQIFSIAGMPDCIAFNCPRTALEGNTLTCESLTNALIEGRSAIFRLSKFCRKYLPGFENAYISDIAEMPGIRVSRRIRGKYVLTGDDIVNSKQFDNPVVISNYPIDIHSTDDMSSKLQHIGEYQIPVESLISDDYNNLYVVGRALSADFEGQSAARVQASCFSMAEGLVKYLANKS
jgi:hypothetical protein